MTSSPVLYAVFCFRYDAHMVRDLLRNISFVDGYVAHDDRANPEKWFNEGSIRRGLIEKARDRGADWVMVIDPDERLERGAGAKVRAFMDANRDRRVIGGFRTRELWGRRHYRVDGVWGQKKRWGLFPIAGDLDMTDMPAHGQPYPLNPDFEREMLDVDLFHLKMLTSSARAGRRDLYNWLDPERTLQKIGYDYLADEANIKLETIPPGKAFHPARPEWWLRLQVERAMRPLREL